MAIGRESLENVFKVSNPKWRTSITKVEPEPYNNKRILIGNVSFSDGLSLLIKGEMPSKKESKMLGSVLVSFCDHE